MKKLQFKILMSSISFLLLLLFTSVPITIHAVVEEEAGPSFGVEENLKCFGSSSHGINTAIGCIPINNKNAFLAWILSWAIGISGGIAIIFTARASFYILTSAGNPDKIAAGKELIEASIAGILFLVLSTLILKIIGVNLFGLPGF